MNAYLLFAKEVKIATLKENPATTQEDIDKLVHQKWRFVLTSEEKRPYFDRAEKLRRDATNKQQRKRDRARIAAAAAALAAVAATSPTSTLSTESESPPSPTASLTAGRDGSGDGLSAPSSPDSGCPSTVDEDASSVSSSSSPSPAKKETKAKTKVASSTQQSRQLGSRPTNSLPKPMLVNPAAIPPYPLYAAPPTAAAAAAAAAAAGVGMPAFAPLSAPHFAYHPMVPQMIQSSYPVSYLHPYFLPPPPMMTAHMNAFNALYGAGRMLTPPNYNASPAVHASMPHPNHAHLYPGPMPSQITAPMSHPHCLTPATHLLYPPPPRNLHPQPQHHAQPTPYRHAGFCPGITAASTPVTKTPAAAAESVAARPPAAVCGAPDDIGSGDASSICSLSLYEVDGKSECSENDVSYEPPTTKDPISA